MPDCKWEILEKSSMLLKLYRGLDLSFKKIDCKYFATFSNNPPELLL